MEYRRIHTEHLDTLWEIHKLYKAEIGECAPDDDKKTCLADAMNREQILFYGAWDGDLLVGCCSVTVGFSTFDYAPSGVLEDFFIRPEYQRRGIARQLVRFAYLTSGVRSLTVGCADCDTDMYRSLGFSIALGNLLAME